MDDSPPPPVASLKAAVVATDLFVTALAPLADSCGPGVALAPLPGKKKRHHVRKVGMHSGRLPTSMAVETSRTHQRNQMGAVWFVKTLTFVRIAASI